MKTVLVFRTSVKNIQETKIIEPLLSGFLNESEKWNFDLEDCDRILRVEAVASKADLIIESLNKIGISCIELEDVLPV